MLEDDSDYEKECQEIRKVNVGLLGEFRTWLASAGKTQAVIRKHCINLDFYLNHFLLYCRKINTREGFGCQGRAGRIRKSAPWWKSPSVMQSRGLANSLKLHHLTPDREWYPETSSL
jgi:hypothetical protein